MGHQKLSTTFLTLWQRVKAYLLLLAALESANWYIMVAHNLFKEVVGKKSGFYVNEIFKSQLSDWLWWGTLTNHKLARWAWGCMCKGTHGDAHAMAHVGVHMQWLMWGCTHNGAFGGHTQRHAWGAHTKVYVGMHVQRHVWRCTHKACMGVSLQLISLCGGVSLQLIRLHGGVSLQLIR